MNYTVWYKKAGSWFWSKLKNVKGDGVIEHNKARYFILDDETRIEIPVDNMIFKFSNQRFINIKKDMERTIGQPISVNSKII